ncbi:MAG TPA: hypothetical protein VFY78_07120, partial [Gammaproteobacteria bacterium]|nr:hypothetical protein [Gammaproteobacteria bacterium]
MKQEILATALISIGFSISGICHAAPQSMTSPGINISAPADTRSKAGAIAPMFNPAEQSTGTTPADKKTHDKTPIPAATGGDTGQTLDKKPGGITNPGKLIIPKMNTRTGNSGGLAVPGRGDANTNPGGGNIVTVPGRSGGSQARGVGGFVIPDGSGNGGSGHVSGVAGFAIPGGRSTDLTTPGQNASQGHNSNTMIRRPRGDLSENDSVTITPAKPGNSSYEKPGYKVTVTESTGGGTYEKPTKDKPDTGSPLDKGPGEKPDKDSGTPNDNNMGSGGSTIIKNRPGDLDRPVRNDNDVGSGDSQKISKDKGTTDGTG